MEWQADGTVIARRPFGENGVIIEVLTAGQGRHAGLVPGGASRRRAAMLQPGSRLQLRWRARRDDQLGTFTAEPLRARAGLLADPLALSGLNAVCALLSFALPERDPHPRLAEQTEALLDAMESGGDWAARYLLWEMLLLDEMGFGLDLSRCAVTGAREGLAYVSPRSGRAVSRQGAGDWADRLLPLPALMGGAGDNRGRGLQEGLAITGHFLESRIAAELAGRRLPAARDRLMRRLLAAAEQG
ncbi:DNA repair protein RecO [Paracoccus siganidrum]|uniref:DNA repair protein RecO n=1 Tax=Paracoccus siganidrum TaxID=1276757 RepID=A0A419A9C1_9RHOB|nr:DNA repair protein RecO [Paracoccus siganidrum]RJL18825.1 DNA repair protein RecO [Paracoccus siganidrum]RMC38855.1 DNA repair protein RecO [Paracoccus siganidrum]